MKVKIIGIGISLFFAGFVVAWAIFEAIAMTSLISLYSILGLVIFATLGFMILRKAIKAMNKILSGIEE